MWSLLYGATHAVTLQQTTAEKMYPTHTFS